MQKLYKTEMKTPIGNLYIFNDDEYIYEISWDKFGGGYDAKEIKNKLGEDAKLQLNQYFKKQRKKFNLPLKLTGTEYRKRAMIAMQEIEYGKTISYKEQSEIMGVKFSQAIGTANKNNKFTIVVPCHRVIKSNGKYGGYNGSEFDKKEFLINLEQSNK